MHQSALESRFGQSGKTLCYLEASGAAKAKASSRVNRRIIGLARSIGNICRTSNSAFQGRNLVAKYLLLILAHPIKDFLSVRSIRSNDRRSRLCILEVYSVKSALSFATKNVILSALYPIVLHVSMQFRLYLHPLGMSGTRGEIIGIHPHSLVVEPSRLLLLEFVWLGC